jgi:hypothetical protein
MNFSNGFFSTRYAMSQIEKDNICTTFDMGFDSSRLLSFTSHYDVSAPYQISEGFMSNFTLT